MDEKGSVCLNTDEDDRSAVAGEDLNNRKELNIEECFKEESFSLIHDVVHVVRDDSKNLPLYRSLSWPYHRFDIHRL